MAPSSPSSRAAPILSARSVIKTFGSTRALSDARIDLRPGEVCGLLGANGAGKSTLSRIISGQVEKTAGEITFDGKPYTARSARDALQSGIALVALCSNSICRYRSCCCKCCGCNNIPSDQITLLFQDIFLAYRKK